MTDNKKSLADIIKEYDDEFNKKMEELSEEAKSDIEFGPMDLKGTEFEIIKNVANFHKWSEKLARHKQYVKRAHNTVNRIYAKIYEECKREMLDIAMKGKSEIETWVCRQPKYAKAKSYLNDLECIQEFMEKTIDNLRNRGFAIKNIIDNRKYFDGG